MRAALIDTLLASDEPSVRWKIRVQVLGEDPQSPAVRRLQEHVRTSARVRQLLEGHARAQPDVYDKWRGAHWVLLTLADIGYPAGDPELLPLRDAVLQRWLDDRFLREFEANRVDSKRIATAVPVVRGRHRRCGSQQGGALLAITKLGIDDGRGRALAERLAHWQWPDGGWNCDRHPDAASSSVYETVLPMRGLAAHGQGAADRSSAETASRAAEVLLTRGVVFHRSRPALISDAWGKLHYPVYWHHDVLSGLKALAELGLLGDPRCAAALDLLASKRLPDSGWPAEAKFYQGATGGAGDNHEHVSWGGVSSKRMNEWVTADALAVLAAAGMEIV